MDVDEEIPLVSDVIEILPIITTKIWFWQDVRNVVREYCSNLMRELDNFDTSRLQTDVSFC